MNNIVIYGAGALGEKVYKLSQICREYHIVAFLETHRTRENFHGVPVWEPGDLLLHHWDIIVLANTYCKTLNTLYELNIPREKIYLYCDVVPYYKRYDNSYVGLPVFSMLNSKSSVLVNLLQNLVSGKEDSDNIRSRYEANRITLANYVYWRIGQLPDFLDLKLRAFQVDEKNYHVIDIETGTLYTSYEFSSYIEKPFFRDLSKPLLLENEMNSYHLRYVIDNLRRSEDFGADNHLYLYYNSIDELCILLQIVDIETFINEKKIVFLIGEKDKTANYPLDFQKRYGIDFEAMEPQPVRVDEIKRILFSGAVTTNAGNVFLSNILDYHPNLLTAGEFAFSNFVYIIENVLAGKTVTEGLLSILNEKNEIIASVMESLFIPAASAQFPTPEFETFITEIRKLFEETYKPDRREWLAACYLAYSNSLGRLLNARIAPAIKLEKHIDNPSRIPGNDFNDIALGIKSLYSLVREFPYYYDLSIVRFPLSALGACECRVARARQFVNDATAVCYFYYINEVFLGGWSFKQLYIAKTDELYHNKGVIRFEDLKIQPKAALETVCDFIDIPWSDTLLETTANGSPASMLSSNGKLMTGFDTSSVAKTYEEYFSPFDYYRLELAFSEFFLPWGYKLHYWADGVQYSVDDIMKLFEVKFKSEDVITHSPNNRRLNEVERRRLLKLVREHLERGVRYDADGNELVPVKWLKPKKEFIDGELYE